MKRIAILFVFFFISANLYAVDVDYYYEKQSTAAVTYRYESTPGAPTFDADTLDSYDSTYFLQAASGPQITTNLNEITQLNIDTATNRTSITNLEISTGQVVTNTNEITQINIDTATNRTSITNLEISTGQVVTNTAEITQLNIDTATIQAQVTTNANEITQLNIDTATIQAQVTTNANEITQINIDTATNRTSITNLEISTGQVVTNARGEYSYDAGEFNIPSLGGPEPHKFEYEIGSTSYPANELRFSSSTDNSAFISEIFHDKYNGGNITFNYHFYVDSDALTVGNIEFNVETTTSTDMRADAGEWYDNAFGLFSPPATAYEIKVATLTISSNLPVAGKLYRMRVWVDVSDTSYYAGNIRMRKVVINFDKN